MYLFPAIPTLIFYLLLLYTSYIVHHYSETEEYEKCLDDELEDGGLTNYLQGKILSCL